MVISLKLFLLAELLMIEHANFQSKGQNQVFFWLYFLQFL